MTTSDFSFAKLPAPARALLPFLDLRTWSSVLYLWLGFPLGLAWFVALVVGFAAGIPLTLVWLGFGILAVTLAGAWLAEGLERQLAIQLLGAKVPERVAPRAAGETLRARLGIVLGGPALWKGLLFLALRFPLGLAGWIFSLVSLVVAFAFLAVPWVEMTGLGEVRIDLWVVSGPFESWLMALAGYVLLVVSLHAQVALGRAWARLAELLLGAQASAATESPRPSTPTLAPAEPMPAGA